jgi:hypothetical protein
VHKAAAASERERLARGRQRDAAQAVAARLHLPPCGARRARGLRVRAAQRAGGTSHSQSRVECENAPAGTPGAARRATL